MYDYDRTSAVAKPLSLGPPKPDMQMTNVLRTSQLLPGSRGDISTAILHAGYLAKRTGKTMWVFGSRTVWAVSDDHRKVLNPAANTGGTVLEISPALVISKRTVVH